jgi:hypothetical protein
VEFTSLDDEDILGALEATAEVNEDLTPPFDYWLVDDIEVWEPSPSGRLIGRLPEFTITGGMKMLRMYFWDLERLRGEE